MPDPVHQIDVLKSPHLRRGDALPRPSSAPSWSRKGLGGRLVELSGSHGAATLTAGISLVRDAQEEGETTAWITTPDSFFFPPDVAESGIDLDALVIVRVPAVAVSRAADKLARSGSFGLILLDLISASTKQATDINTTQRASSLKNSALRVADRVPTPMQSRLLGLAQKHDIAIVFLTQKSDRRPSMGSLISLRGTTRRFRTESDQYQVEVAILKDKRRAPGWHHRELCRGPAGLC